MTVTEALTAEQGRYEWGVRDCLTTAVAVLHALGRSAPDYQEWRDCGSELRATCRALIRHGNIAQAHRAVFESAGLRWHTPDFVHGPDVGDVLVVIGSVRDKTGTVYEIEYPMAHLAFVSESYEAWSWRGHALAPVEFCSLAGVIR